MSNFHVYRSDGKIDQFYDTDPAISLVISVTNNGELLIYEYFTVNVVELTDVPRLVAAYQSGHWTKVTDTTYDTSN
jgi:hypothetical protein